MAGIVDRSNEKEVESSPDGRYVRYDIKLGSGAYKDVFLCVDEESGKEMAWNTVDLRRLPSDERKRVQGETEILDKLKHPYIIKFYDVWTNKVKDQICFTTEIVTSGTLKQYTQRNRSGLKMKVMKRWCKQILDALNYLHSHNPPIIHRDLKCDNIFMNGGTAEIRIGDFGLSASRHKTTVNSVLGTPEFMAPELYEEAYNEMVDIYAFGMCVLEMATKEYPYQECQNPAQIWKKVTSGQKPEVIRRIQDPQLRAFLDLCLCPLKFRLSARDLLNHPFLAYSDSVNDDMKVMLIDDPGPESGGTNSAAPVSKAVQDTRAAILARAKEPEPSPPPSPKPKKKTGKVVGFADNPPDKTPTAATAAVRNEVMTPSSRVDPPLLYRGSPLFLTSTTWIKSFLPLM